MSIVYLFADESGNFDFSRQRGATRYFVLATIVADGCEVGNALLDLRRELTMEGFDFLREFHATDDSHHVRLRVFELLSTFDFRVDATIFDKPKTRLHVRDSVDRFYKSTWFYHLKYVAPRVTTRSDHLFVVAAQFQTKAKRKQIDLALREVCQQVVTCDGHNSACWPAAIDPCLQVADYCAWAIFRKWESNDDTYYRLIEDKIHSEWDMFHFSDEELY